MHQPRLFKSHQEKLSTAGQGISSVPTQTHKQNSSQTRKKLSPLKRLFSKKIKSGSEASGSRLSIDYDHFCITDFPPPTTKRFSESHVNPDISFSTEGKLAQAEEVVIALETVPASRLEEPTFTDNDLYESASYSSSVLRQMRSSLDLTRENEAMPVTFIDEIAADSTSDFEGYEQTQLDVHDFTV